MLLPQKLNKKRNANYKNTALTYWQVYAASLTVFTYLSWRTVRIIQKSSLPDFNGKIICRSAWVMPPPLFGVAKKVARLLAAWSALRWNSWTLFGPSDSVVKARLSWTRWFSRVSTLGFPPLTVAIHEKPRLFGSRIFLPLDS